jgi:hypothetical protein
MDHRHSTSEVPLGPTLDIRSFAGARDRAASEGRSVTIERVGNDSSADDREGTRVTMQTSRATPRRTLEGRRCPRVDALRRCWLALAMLVRPGPRPRCHGLEYR